MLTAYIDDSYKESYDDRTSKGLVVAGYVASVDNWAQFQVEWQAVLDREGVADFHRAEMETYWKSSRYRHWSTGHRNEILGQCHDIIKRHAAAAFGAGVLYRPYDRLPHADKAVIGSVYALCAKRGLDELLAWSQNDIVRAPIKVVFDRGSPRGEVTEAIERFYPGIEDGGTGDRRSLNPLQAADFMAYEGWKLLDRGHNDMTEKEVRIALRQMRLGSERMRFSVFDDSTLPHYVETARRRGF